VTASGRGGGRSRDFALALSVSVYAGVVAGLWLAVEFLVDRVWPATLLGFGPRWVTALPLVPLAVWVLAAVTRPRVWRHLCALAMTSGVLVFGVMDFRLGAGRASGIAPVRVMTHNVGESRVTAEAVDRLMRAEQIDVAALQECPFYDNGPARLGWEFFYGGDLCLVSRFPFTVLDVADPDTAWEHSGFEPMRFEIQTPTGTFQLLNVHLETIRDAITGLGGSEWSTHFTANRTEARRQSMRARARLSGVKVPVIVAGDFNLPEESVIYGTVWGDLLNAFGACGRGFGYTKFTLAFGVRIDHVLAPADWHCARAYVLASPYGGDHAPLIAELTPRWSLQRTSLGAEDAPLVQGPVRGGQRRQ